MSSKDVFLWLRIASEAIFYGLLVSCSAILLVLKPNQGVQAYARVLVCRPGDLRAKSLELLQD